MKVKRIVSVVLILLLITVTVGYKLGWFNEIISTYQQERAVNDLKGTSTAADGVASASISTEDNAAKGASTVVDGAASASISTGDNEVKEGGSGLSIPQSVPNEQSQSLVSMVQSPKQTAAEITEEEISNMVREAVKLSGGFEDLIKDNQVVVLKPNLVQMHVDSTGDLFEKELNGITTDWRVAKAVVELVREYNPNGKIYIMEGAAGDKTRSVMKHLNYTPQYIPGVDEFIAIEEDSGGWQDYSSSGLVKFDLPNGLLHKEYYFNAKYFKADVLISLPTLKTNSGSVVTGGIKNVSIGATPANIYGVSATNPGRTKMVSHKITDGDLDKWIYDYYMCKPVNFTIIDGLVGFQNGPVPIGKKNIQSDKMNMRLIMAGKDAVAVDAVEALVEGWDPLSIRYLGYLNGSSMGNLDTAKITIAGKQVDEVRKDFSIRFPKLGGTRITDKSKPEFEIKKLEADGKKLKLALEAEGKVVKAEVYIDGILFKSVRAGEFDEVAIDIGGLTDGKHMVSTMAFDRFLNHSEKLLEFTK